MTLAAVVSAIALAACGSSNDNKSSSNGGGAEIKPVSGQKKGGTLQVQSVEGFEHLDPGSSYFQLDYEVVYAAHRPLYSFKPEDPTRVVPDLAASDPQISRRREDRDDQDPPERQVQPARQPRGHVEGRQVRHRARLQPQCRQRLRPVVLQRRRRGRHGEGRTDRRHPDARRHDDRVQAHQAVRGDDGQGAVAATVGARAQGVRGQDQRRRQVPERLRLRPGQAGIHGAVRHQVLRGRQEHRAGPEPELGPRGLGRLPAGLRGRGELADRDRPERFGPQDPHRPGPDQRRHPGCPGGQARGPEVQGPDQLHPAGQPLHRHEHRDPAFRQRQPAQGRGGGDRSQGASAHPRRSCGRRHRDPLPGADGTGLRRPRAG